jgi:hypothetical protein
MAVAIGLIILVAGSHDFFGEVAAMAAGLADLVARAAWSMTRVGRGMRRILAQPQRLRSNIYARSQPLSTPVRRLRVSGTSAIEVFVANGVNATIGKAR